MRWCGEVRDGWVNVGLGGWVDAFVQIAYGKVRGGQVNAGLGGCRKARRVGTMGDDLDYTPGVSWPHLHTPGVE